MCICDAYHRVISVISSLWTYHDSFVRERDHLTVTLPDGTTYTAYKTETIERGEVKHLQRNIEVWSSSSHPQGRQLLESVYHEYNSASEKHLTKDSKDTTKDKLSLIKVEN